MEKLIEILEDIQPGVDYATCENLIDGQILNSLTILALVAEIEDAFDVVIPAVWILPENFNSAARIWNLICRLEEEDN